jgi:hypothetical protein
MEAVEKNRRGLGDRFAAPRQLSGHAHSAQLTQRQMVRPRGVSAVS